MKRLRHILLLTGAVLLALYFVPQLPPVRDALLRVAASFAARSGYDVHYRESAGNPWRNLQLLGLSVTGKGVDASLETLEVSYTLPALLGRTLPIEATLRGLRGEVDLGAFTKKPATAPQEPPGAARRALVTPLLRNLAVSDVDLTVRGIPYYDAPLTLTRLELDGEGNALEFDAALRAGAAAGQGVAELEGRATLAPLTIDATVQRADIALARPYFDGAKAGSLEGSFQLHDGDVAADLELHEAQVDIVGLTLNNVSGPLSLRDMTLATTLEGQALGGALQGSGSVDLRAQHWQGTVRGNARLQEALVWLGQGRLTQNTVANTLGAKGDAEVILKLAGWQSFTLAGSATGQGELLREPLRDLEVDFSYATDVGTSAQATAALGGQPLSFALEPKDEGFTMRARGEALPLYGFRSDATLDLEAEGGKLTGGGTLNLSRRLLGREVRLEANATTDGSSWQADLRGQDARGAELDGQVTLRGASVTGNVNLTRLELPGLEAPVTLRAQAEGPLSELPLNLQLTGPAGVHPASGGIRADADFSGRARAVLSGSRLAEIQGDFGPLSVQGALDDLRYSLEPTPLSGRATGRVALTDGRLLRQEGTLNTRATLQTQTLQAAGVALPDLNAALSLQQGQGLSARVQDEEAGVNLALEDGRLRGTFAGTRLGALGETFALGGNLSGTIDALPETLELDLRAETPGSAPGTTLRASGTGENLRLTVQADAGASLAGRTFGGPLELSGETSLRAREANLSGTLGDLELELNAAPSAEGTLKTQTRLGTGPDAFSADFQNLKEWRTEGTLPLGKLGKTLGLPLTGTLETTLRSDGGRFSGSAAVQGRAFGLPLSAALQGRGKSLTISAESRVLEQPLTLSGTALPTTDMRVAFGPYGTLRLQGSPQALRVSGTGEVPELNRAGLRVAPQPWSLTGNVAEGTARLVVGASTLRAQRQGDGWALRAQLEQVATFREEPLSLAADFSAAPDLSWQGTLTGQGTLPYRALETELNATLRGTGSTYRGAGTLELAGESIDLELSGEGAHAQARAVLSDLALAPFAPAEGTLSGEVRLNTNGQLRYFANLEAEGEAFGRPFDLNLSADHASGLNLNGSAAGTRLRVQGGLPLRHLNLTFANSQQPFDLIARVTLGSRIGIEGTGGWRGQALSLGGTFTPARGSGQLRLSLADAELSAQLTPRAEQRDLNLSLSAPSGLLNLTMPARADLSATLGSPSGNTALTLHHLSAALGTNRLTLAGTVRPEMNLTGELLVPLRGIAPADTPIALSLHALETGYLARLRQDTLELRSVLTPAFRPERVRLEGTLQRQFAARSLNLVSDLVWQEGRGFEGQSDVGLKLSRTLTSELTLSGSSADDAGLSGLRLAGSTSYRDTKVLTLRSDLSDAPWRDRGLSGQLELSAPVAQLVSSWPGDPLEASGNFALSGTLSEPVLAGPLALSGAIVSTGNLRAGRQGGTLTLNGEGLQLSAHADTAGFTSTLSLETLDLTGILPQLVRADAAPEPTLSGLLRATQRWGKRPQLRLSNLAFVSASSSVRGRASYDGTLNADVQADLDLADLSPALSGRVRGPLKLASQSPLSGTLTLTELGPAAADWHLGGTLQLAGSLNNPDLDLELSGGGTARGQLEARIAPQQGHLRLRSDLNVAGVRSALNLTRTRLGLSAGGTLAYREYGVRLQGEGQRVRFSGTQRLEGWRGLYGPNGLNLSGGLGRLNPQLRGRLELRSTATLGQIRGSLRDVAVGPVTLGDLALHEQKLPSGRGLELSGDALAATVGLSGALPWQLSRLSLELPGTTVVTASGAGERQRGELEATVEAASLSLPVRATYANGTLDLAAQGELPLGQLAARARLLEGRWQGQIEMTETGTETDVSETKTILRSRLSGELSAPRLEGEVDLERSGNALRGTFSLSRESAALAATLSSPQLASPLHLRTTGWPLELTLSRPQLASPQRLRLRLEGGNLLTSGRLTLRVGPALTVLRPSPSGGLTVRLEVPAAQGLALRTTLPRRLSDYAALAEGLELRGAAQTQGRLELALRPYPQVQAEQLRWRSRAGTLSLNGSARLQEGFRAALSGRWQGGEGAPLPWLRTATLPFTFEANAQQFTLDSSGPLGTLSAHYDPATQRVSLESGLTLGQGTVQSDLSYTPQSGPSGNLVLTALPVFRVGDELAQLRGDLELSPSGLSGDGALGLVGGEAELAGQAGWGRFLPETLHRFFPQGGQTLVVQARLNRFDLSALPPLEARLPYLNAPISGVATLTGRQLIGQLIAPDLRVLDTRLPTSLDFNGNLSALEARASFGDSLLNLSFKREPGNSRLAGLLTLETFPLQLLAEAAVGPSQVDASATGAARFNLSLADLRASYVRLATERLTLRSTNPATPGAAQTTEGSVSLRFENGSLFVERADFQGDGSWRAQGVLTPETLDFTFDAQEANFSPLLRLVPPLAAFNIGAQGTLNVRAQGSAAEPEISLTSPGLDLSVAGTQYRVNETTASLVQGVFDLDSDITALAPIEGELALRGSGEIGLNPLLTRDLELRFSGDAAVPTLGDISALRGRIYPSPSGWQLNGRGVLGNPFTVTGSLTPLDLRLRGTELNVQAPRFFLDSSSTDADLTIRTENNTFVLDGSAFVNRAQLSLNRGRSEMRAAAGSAEAAREVPAALAPEESLSPDSVPVPTEPSEAITSETLAEAIIRTPNPVLARVIFEDIGIRAPGQVSFTSGFGSAELGFDVTLSGTAATPQLSGEGNTLQGTIAFSGQDFTIQEATATFDPTRGVFPTLDLEAQVNFDKNQALGTLVSEGFDIVEPTGSTFTAFLNITGSFEEAPSGRRALNLDPTLSSNAALQETNSTPRPLNETELLTLLTLGRLQLDAPIVGTNGLAETVATSALDTAVDLFLISELQDALSSVLGVDLEIRTSALSSVLGPDPQNFGVSVKLGGYLSDNLFASVEVGSFDDPDQAYALTNEFTLRYTVNPLELNLSGGVNFLEDNSAVTDFSLGLSYALTTRLSLDASLATNDSGRDTSIGFGVSFVW